MAYTEAFITRAIADVRESIDEPIINAKYTDARVITHLEKSFALILAEKQRNEKTPIVVKQTITVASGVTKYILPYTMKSLLGVYQLSSTSGTKVFYDGRSRYNPYGQKIWLEGNTLNIQTVNSFGIGTALTAEWIPNGLARLHNGTCTLDADGDTVTFGSSPNAGTLDTHAQAYAGCIFRILELDGDTVTGNYMQERIISSYDNTSRAATLEKALDPVPTTDNGAIYYEIAPFIFGNGMDSVLPLYTAWKIASMEGNKKRADGLLKTYQNEIRNVRLSAYYSNMPENPRVRSDSFDNRRYRRI